MNKIPKLLKSQAAACFLISSFVLLVVLGIRWAGYFQAAELAVYDQFLRLRVDDSVADERIVICAMTENDLVKYGHPLNDEKLADLFDKLLQAQPCVIGLDIYRDLKEPRDGSLYPKLAEVLEKNDKIIAIERLGKVKGPPALIGKPERVALNNLPRDYTVDNMYRRAYLFLEQGLTEARPSFALALASDYLTAHKVEMQMLDSADGPILKIGNVCFPRITPYAGCYVGLPCGDYSILADYKNAHAYNRIAFSDVLENPPLIEELKDKVILVATDLDSVKDSNKSPVDPEHRGVLQHASIIRQLFRAGFNGEVPTAWWSESQEVLWIAMVTFIGGLLGLWCGTPWRLAPTLITGLGGVAFCFWFAMRHDVWIPAVAPAGGLFLSATFVTSYTAYLQKSQLGAMRSIFSQHVSSSVVEALWADRENLMSGGHLKPQRVVATVFFTDLKNFSTTSEKMDPATLLLWMNEYMNRIVPNVERYGGMINKFIGDAIMAVFGVPVPRGSEEALDQDAVNAVRCALAMAHELRLLNADWLKRGLPTTSMRVGINTGTLVSGSFGSSSRMEFTVLGDTVNTGARLEGAGKEIAPEDCNPECTILISEATYVRLGGRFEAKLIGPMSLKGKGEKIIVYSVLSERLDHQLT